MTAVAVFSVVGGRLGGGLLFDEGGRLGEATLGAATTVVTAIVDSGNREGWVNMGLSMPVAVVSTSHQFVMLKQCLSIAYRESLGPSQQ